MLNFQFYQRVKMLFGEGSVNQVGELVTEAGYKKPLIVCDPGIVATGLIDKIGKSLEDAGLEYLVYDKVIPDPPYTVVDEGAALSEERDVTALSPAEAADPSTLRSPSTC